NENIQIPSGVRLLATDRGGLETYHGPGQWVVFVVNRLETLTGDRRGVRKAVGFLLQAALRAIQGLPEGRTAVLVEEGEKIGIWRDPALTEKVASVGISVRKGILHHGLAINGYFTPESFVGINPCGIPGARAGYVIPETIAGPDRPAAFEKLRGRLEAELRAARLA
ncbi:MAG: hypothetical protein AAB425_06330, partial [Bdellovibrionota bacterium]